MCSLWLMILNKVTEFGEVETVRGGDEFLATPPTVEKGGENSINVEEWEGAYKFVILSGTHNRRRKIF